MTTTEFTALGIPEFLTNTLAAMGYVTPTAIQAQSIPVALEGTDVLASATTGSGKTAAFVIPLIAHLLSKKVESALILTPTRELAMQVSTVVKKMLANNNNIRMALLIGGDPMMPQTQHLRRKPAIVVGTPGRVIDHIKRGNLHLSGTNYLVLDEADRMLDMGFGIQLDEILPHLSQTRQTLMFSATLPTKVAGLAQRYLKKPSVISIGAAHLPSKSIKQEVVHTTSNQKYGHLTQELTNRNGSIIIFVSTKRGADMLATKLNAEGHLSNAMHGDLQQRKRERLIRSFHGKQFRILVATDVAARGLDISHVEHVINYDLPRQPEDYIHRIGRTGRAGAEGAAVSLLLPEDKRVWASIARFIAGGELSDVPAYSRPANRNTPNRSGAPFRSDRNEGGRKPSFAGDGAKDAPRSYASKRPFGKRTEEGGKPAFANGPRPFKKTSRFPKKASVA